MTTMRDLVLLEAKAVFRGVRMSSAKRRYAATSGAIGSPAVRPGPDVRGSKPSTAKLRKQGVVVPRKAGLKKADRLAARRQKLVAKRNAPPKAARPRKVVDRSPAAYMRNYSNFGSSGSSGPWG